MLDKVHAAAARAILPAFRTTPSVALLREAGLSPARMALDCISGRAAARIRKLDSRHPLFQRGRKSLLSPALSSIPTTPSTSGVNNFRDFVGSVPPADIQVYSDGSKLPDDRTGGGYVIFQLGLQIKTEAFPLGTGKEAFDAEAHAALKGIQAAVALPSARFASNEWLFVDKIEVAARLFTKTTSISSQNTFLDASEMPQKWKAQSRLLHTCEGRIKIRWIPSHSGIEGNDLADTQTKRGPALLAQDFQEKLSIASHAKWLSTQMSQAREKWWKDHIPLSYARFEINNAPAFPKKLLLDRKALGQIIAARTGHGDFAAYHTRFNHEEANNNCRCGSPNPRHTSSSAGYFVAAADVLKGP
ncbi:hypothetical protein K3495_g8005 [Podosphaera aphanis]|nr:hypothetical protein K3495_g8005 [Podosphaera aphanis]